MIPNVIRLLPAPYERRLEFLSRCIATSVSLCKNRAGKHRSTVDHTKMLTYEMAQKPHHIGVRKAWLSWHTMNLEEFRQRQPYQVAQDAMIRRFVRGFFIEYFCVDGSEIVIKRRGNCVYVAGFLTYEKFFSPKKIYWLFGFAEEFLSILLKQPVKLELQMVPTQKTLAYTYV